MKRRWMGHAARVCSFATIAAALTLMAPGPGKVEAAGPSEAGAQKTLTRSLEPVILKGASLTSFTKAPVDELFIYAFDGAQWQQIPAQVDEVDSDTGKYVATEDGLFDADDEIVFMAADTGDEAPTGTVLSDELPINSAWYEVRVTDPVNNTHNGWVYIVRSSTLTATNPTDYVNFNDATSRVTGKTYTLGFATPHPWADYLSLGTGSVDILDRNKVRVGALTEETGNLSVLNAPIKDGKVRIIIRDGRVLGYGSMISWSTPIPLFFATDVRISFDFSAQANGGKLYNAAVPAGVTVDGTDDAMPDTPASPWFQLSTAGGTLIQVVDQSVFGSTATLSNYYDDTLTANAGDTGDGVRYGETGLRAQYAFLSSPSSITYNFSLYTFADSQANIGATYEEYYRRPLITEATRLSSGPTGGLYLPLLATNQPD